MQSSEFLQPGRSFPTKIYRILQIKVFCKGTRDLHQFALQAWMEMQTWIQILFEHPQLKFQHSNLACGILYKYYTGNTTQSKTSRKGNETGGDTQGPFLVPPTSDRKARFIMLGKRHKVRACDSFLKIKPLCWAQDFCKRLSIIFFWCFPVDCVHQTDVSRLTKLTVAVICTRSVTGKHIDTGSVQKE
jgi:hypothetical protein